MNVLQDVSRQGRELMQREVFYGLFLSTLNKAISKQVPTAGVSKNGINVQLSINEEFWTKLPEKVRQGVLKHELK